LKLAEQLITLRKKEGWTQAEAAKIISIQQSYLSKLENGHFVPSDDVIEKLSNAYNIKSEKLRHAPKKRFISNFNSILLPLLGIFLLTSGANALLFSSTFYTYKTEPVLPADKDELYFDYHLTDTYMGEKLIADKSGTKYHFTLIASRDIDRKENKIQIIFGIAFILISIGLNFNRLIAQFKRHIASNNENSL